LQQAANLMSNSLRSFAAFVPVGIVRQLITSGRPVTLSGESRFLTIFFSDLEDFSTVSERLSPEELMRQVSSYFEVVVGALTRESATIDKFIGDSVMAFWGAPTEVPDQVYRACVGALRAANRVSRLNHEWARDGRPQMRMRIGLHCADVVVGNVGSSERLSYTVMGDGVNVASRLEGVNKIFHTTICISESVYDAVADRIIARPIQFVSVKGRQSRVMVYELMGIRDTVDPELFADAAATRLCTMTTCALTALTAEHLTEAQVKYQELLAEYPSDPVARYMVDHLTDAVPG
jgi:adenylate cyclase